MACDRNLIVKEDEEEEKINTSTVDTTPTAPVNATEGLVHTKFKRVKSHTKAKDAMAGSTVMSMKKAAAVQTLTATNTKGKVMRKCFQSFENQRIVLQLSVKWLYLFFLNSFL